ncbi:MAG: hypothetical protein PUC18_13320 [Prevotellaceae bacterium]|nr:hypothetical protein [Prevotellaceae bacterium]
MATIEEIIAKAKTKESWNVTHEWNYGPIDYLYHELVEKCVPKMKEVTETIMMFEKYVHKVTDAETYFVWQHKRYDLVVRSNELIQAIRDTFPDVPFLQVCEWIRKHEGEQQTSTAINYSMLPIEIANQLDGIYNIPATHQLLRL